MWQSRQNRSESWQFEHSDVPPNEALAWRTMKLAGWNSVGPAASWQLAQDGGSWHVAHEAGSAAANVEWPRMKNGLVWLSGADRAIPTPGAVTSARVGRDARKVVGSTWQLVQSSRVWQVAHSARASTWSRPRPCSSKNATPSCEAGTG